MCCYFLSFIFLADGCASHFNWSSGGKKRIIDTKIVCRFISHLISLYLLILSPSSLSAVVRAINESQSARLQLISVIFVSIYFFDCLLTTLRRILVTMTHSLNMWTQWIHSLDSLFISMSRFFWPFRQF